MSKSWITETQVAGAAAVIVVHVLKKMGIDLDPAFLSITISGVTYALTVLLRKLQKNAERLSDLAVSYSDGVKTEEISELKMLVIDQREQMHKAGVPFVIADGINE